MTVTLLLVLLALIVSKSVARALPLEFEDTSLAEFVRAPMDIAWDASSDDVGVVAYDIYRDSGFLDSVGPVTIYQDTTVAPENAYQYVVYARDAAGDVSDPSDPADVVTLAQPSGLALSPTDDAYVRENSPDRNYGSGPLLEVDGSSKKDVLLKFDLSGIGTASVPSVIVRLYNLDGSGFGGEFFEVSDFYWTEDFVTFANAPAAGASLGSLGGVTPGNWYEIDLTAALNAALSSGDPYFSLRITSPDANGADYASKENSNGFSPELVLVLQ